MLLAHLLSLSSHAPAWGSLTLVPSDRRKQGRQRREYLFVFCPSIKPYADWIRPTDRHWVIDKQCLVMVVIISPGMGLWESWEEVTQPSAQVGTHQNVNVAMCVSPTLCIYIRWGRESCRVRLAASAMLAWIPVFFCTLGRAVGQSQSMPMQ